MPNATKNRRANVRARPRPLLARREKSEPEELLLRIALRGGSARLRSSDLRSMADDSFLRAFHLAAAAHGVIGLVLTAVKQSPAFGSLDEATRQRFLAPLRPYIRQAALWEAETDRLLAALAESAIMPVVLKGGALRATVYQDPSERLSGDLDLLVSAHRVDDTITGLERCGYVVGWSDSARAEHLRRGYHLSLDHPSGFVVEVHWDLAPRQDPYRFDSAAFVNRSIVLPRTGATPVRVPCREHMVLHLAYQNREDSFARLKRLIDIDRVIAAEPGHEFDWDYLIHQARRARLEAVLGLCLQLCSRTLGTPVPADAIRRLRIPFLTRIHLALMRPQAALISQHVHYRGAAKRALHLWLTPGWRQRKRWIARFLKGYTNPLALLYAERNGAVIATGAMPLAVRVRKLVQVAAYHSVLYASALAGVVGRREPEFWAARSPAARSATCAANGSVPLQGLRPDQRVA